MKSFNFSLIYQFILVRIKLEATKCFFEGEIISVVECYKQINSDICGFHCLFNLFQFTKVFLNEHPSVQRNIKNGAKYFFILLNNTKNFSFWKFYLHLLKDLLLNFPNKAELKALHNLGPLDRVHMDYILEVNNYQEYYLPSQHSKELKNIQELLEEKFKIKVFIQPFLYGFGNSNRYFNLKLTGIIQNSDEEIKKIQDFAFLVQAKKKEQSFLAMFPLGITIHWVSFRKFFY